MFQFKSSLPQVVLGVILKPFPVGGGTLGATLKVIVCSGVVFSVLGVPISSSSVNFR